MTRSIMHMDLDSFFVSVERLLNSKLIGKPVLVGGSGDRGVVASCSYEARAFGIHSAMPMKVAKRLCPEAIIVRGDYEQYSKCSNEVTQIISESAPLFERASIDEFYMDFTGMDKFFGCYSYGTELRQRIIRETGLPISFGMSVNKTVSKVATGEAKPNNQLMIEDGTEKNFLGPLSIKKIPMIGDKTYALLRNMGVEKVHTLQQMPVELMQNVLGENGIVIWRKANGIDNSAIEPYNERKSISCEETFVSDTMDVNTLKQVVIKMVEKLSFQLRFENKLTACVTVKIRYSDFETHTIQSRMPHTSHDHTLIGRAKELFERLYNRRALIRLIGVRFSHLVGGGQQINMFEDSEKIVNLYQAMDKMRILYGAHSIHRAIGLTTSLRSFNPFNGIASTPDKDGKLNSNEYQYLLVINPSRSVSNDITEEKKSFARQYKFPQAEKAKPHITLMQITMNESQESSIIDSINELCLLQQPIEIRLENYDFFSTHTLYIKVVNPALLIDFVKSLKQKLSLPPSQSFFSFYPHVTIARSLTKELSEKARFEYENKEYKNFFIVHDIFFMKRKEQYEKYLTIKEFELCDNRFGVGIHLP